MMLVYKLVTVIFLYIGFVAGRLYKGDECKLKNGNNGICKMVAECPEAIANLQLFLISPLQCEFEGTQLIVCCTTHKTTVRPKPTTTTTTTTTTTARTMTTPKNPPSSPKPSGSTAAPDINSRTPEVKPSGSTASPDIKSRTPGVIANQKCREYAEYVWTVEPNPTPLKEGELLRRKECPFIQLELVVGGLPATEGEFPHMVQLGYDASEGLSWACGGSLISDQYVLTAAHCLSHRSLGDAKYARMGITDLEVDDHKQQFDIAQIIPHPQYKAPSHYHDIGLVKLNRKVELNIWVRPACLYTNRYSPWSKVIASGWGKTNLFQAQSRELLRVILELYDQPKCNKTFRQRSGSNTLMEGIRDDLMICAGHSKDYKDTCGGDSGGPLQVYRSRDNETECMYDIIGVTSFGLGCGLEVDKPGVYTRVSYYIKWIEDIVWPQHSQHPCLRFLVTGKLSDTRILPEQCTFEGSQIIVCCETPKTTVQPKPKTTNPPSPPRPSRSTVSRDVKSRTPGIISNQKCREYAQYVGAVDQTLLIGKGDQRRNNCSFYRQNIGESLAASREFPHMVQFGYEARDGPLWTCGGSLISDQYVLTSARCLSDRSLGDAKYARMGITDLEVDDHKQQFDIAQIIPHPEFEEPSFYHDIGLVKLNKQVELNSWVRPACLYTPRSSPWSKVIACGWGQTHFGGDQSSVLSKVILELYDQPKCSKTYRQQSGSNKLMEGIRDDLMICAGLSKELLNLCQGNSGAPLQVYKNKDNETECMYDIIGVTSFGKACGIAVDRPDVYTRVSYYTKWIEDIVWPPM